MRSAKRLEIKWRQVIRDDCVHRNLYLDPDVFAAELERIFHGTRIYVGHDSEIPEPGDYRP